MNGLIKKTEWLLKNYIPLKKAVENMTQEIKEIEAETPELSGIDYAKDRLSETYKFNSDTENQALRTVERIDLLKRKIFLAQSKIERIERALTVLNETERAVIESYYFRSLPYYAFCYKIFRSERSTRRIKQRAINKIMVAMFADGIGNTSYRLEQEKGKRG